MIFKAPARSRAFMLLGAGLGALTVANPVFAQATAPDAAEIVVTGVRASVGSALELKRTATQLQESIVAEDIGKLPDNNVVEALQHVAGVSILRTSVEPNTVLIRGLPDITTTLNNRQIFTSSSRTISLPDFPAELLARVDVKKSSSADDIEGGIAGLINVTLHKPLDFPGLQIAGGIKATHGSLSKKWAPNANILLSNRWDTDAGEFGILANASYQKRNVSQDVVRQNQWNLQRCGVAGVGSTPGTGVPAGCMANTNTVTLTQADTQIERKALNATAQYRSNSGGVELYVDYFYSELKNQAPVDVNVLLLGTCPNAGASSPFPGTNIGEVLVNGCYGLTSLQNRRSWETTQQLATGGTFNIGDRLSVKAQGNYTWSNNNTIAFIPDAQYNFNSPTSGLTTTMNPNNSGGVFIDQPGDPQMSPDTYLNQWYDTRAPQKGHEWAGRIDANYITSDDGFIRSIDFGYRYNDRSAVADSAFTGLNCANTTGDGANPYNKYRLLALNSEACLAYRAETTATRVGGQSYADFGADSFRPTKGSFFGGQFGTTQWVNMDPDWVWDNAEAIRNKFGYSGPFDLVPTNHFEVSERAHAGYLKANYAIDFGEMTIDGNIGMRAVRTTLTEGGFTQQYVPVDPLLRSTQGANATCTTCLVYTPAVSTKSDTQWLPSFNLRWLLTDGLYLRAAAGKTVTRPTFAQLNPGLTVSAATATLLGTATGGNPDLNPVKSTNFDLDLSYYWGSANHITLAMFYRKVAGYIQTRQSTLVIEGNNYTLSRPENYQDASIQGFEVGYSQFLDFLPGLLSGFGWDVNATFIDAPFNNVAKRQLNASGIYEKGPVSLRLSYTYSAPYRIADFNGGAQPQFRTSATRTNMDFSANFRLNDNVTVSFDATNILNSRQREYAGVGALNSLIFPTSLSRFDRTFSLGARFKL